MKNSSKACRSDQVLRRSDSVGKHGSDILSSDPLHASGVSLDPTYSTIHHRKSAGAHRSLVPRFHGGCGSARSAGAALISALLIVAFVVPIVVGMSIRQQLAIRRSQQMMNNDKAFLLAQGVEDWAVGVLLTTKKSDLINYPIKLPRTKVPNGYVTGSIEDLQSKLSINNMQNEYWQAMFERLLKNLNKNITKQQAQSLSNEIKAWVSRSTFTGDSSYYQQLKPPYGIAHRYMASLSELRLVKGITASRYQLLFPYLNATPWATQVNVNSASEQILLALSDKITPKDVQTIIDEREKRNGFKTDDRLNKFIEDRKISIERGLLTTESTYFLVRADIHLEKQHLIVYSFLQRAETRKNIWVNVTRRSRAI